MTLTELLLTNFAAISGALLLLWLISIPIRTAIGPTLMTILLLEVSGISLLEKSLATLSRQIAGQACWPQLGDAGNALAVLHIGQQAAHFLPDYRVALARTGLKSVPLKH